MQTKQVTKRILVQTNLFDFIKGFYFSNQELIICTIYWIWCIGVFYFLKNNYSNVKFELDGINITKQYIDVLTKCNYINLICIILTFVYASYSNFTTKSNGIEKIPDTPLFGLIFVSMVIKGFLCWQKIAACEEKCLHEISPPAAKLNAYFTVTNIFNIFSFFVFLGCVCFGCLWMIGVVCGFLAYGVKTLLKKIPVNYVKEYESSTKTSV